MGRGSVGQGFQEETESLRGFLGGDLQDLEDALLHRAVVDADAAAAEFVAVRHDVVGEGTHRRRVALQKRQIVRVGAGEGMVDRGQPALLFRIAEQGEVGDPSQAELVAGVPFLLPRHFPPHRAEGRAHGVFGTRREEQQVAGAASGRFEPRTQALLADRLQQRRADASLRERGPEETPGAGGAGDFGQAVQHLPGIPAAAARRQPAHGSAFPEHPVEQGMAGAGGFPRQVPDLGAVAQVGAVHAEAVHRLLVGEPREGRGHRDPDCAERAGEQALGDLDDLVGVGEGHLDIHLGELRLAVGAEVLVAEAADDLVVAVGAADHQELLEELRGLGQGVEAAPVDAGGDQVVAGALRGGSGEERGLDLDEAALVEVGADFAGQSGAEAEVSLALRVAEVEVAVAEAQVLGDGVGLRRGEGRSASLAQQVDRFRFHFDFAGRQLGVHGLRGPFQDRALHRQYPPGAGFPGGGHRRGVGADDDLGGAPVVAEVEEQETAEVADALDPAHEHRPFPGVGAAEVAAGVGAPGRGRRCRGGAHSEFPGAGFDPSAAR